MDILYPTLKRAGLKTEIACCDGGGWEAGRQRITGIQAAGRENLLGLATAHGYSSRPGLPFNTTKRVWQTEWSTFDAINYNWYSTGLQSDGLTWANNIQQAFSYSNVNGFLYWWGAANATDNESLIFVNGTNQVRVTARLWAHAHFGKKFIRKGATRIGTSVTGDTTKALNVTAFANTDGTTAIQVINNGNTTETVTVKGVNAVRGQRAVFSYLTNQQNNLTQKALEVDNDQVNADVPAKSLLSFIVSTCD